MTQLTELLGRMQAGDPQAREALFASAYSELHRLAHARLRDGGRNTVLDTTCLVHESYLRFVRVGELRAEDRRAFFAYASQVMRSVWEQTSCRTVLIFAERLPPWLRH
jgi:DNA-directed RNA polymerase specialized sigma24 family protein